MKMNGIRGVQNAIDTGLFTEAEDLLRNLSPIANSCDHCKQSLLARVIDKSAKMEPKQTAEAICFVNLLLSLNSILIQRVLLLVKSKSAFNNEQDSFLQKCFLDLLNAADPQDLQENASTIITNLSDHPILLDKYLATLPKTFILRVIKTNPKVPQSLSLESSLVLQRRIASLTEEPTHPNLRKRKRKCDRLKV